MRKMIVSSMLPIVLYFKDKESSLLLFSKVTQVGSRRQLYRDFSTSDPSWVTSRNYTTLLKKISIRNSINRKISLFSQNILFFFSNCFLFSCSKVTQLGSLLEKHIYKHLADPNWVTLPKSETVIKKGSFWSLLHLVDLFFIQYELFYFGKNFYIDWYKLGHSPLSPKWQ